MKTVTEIESQIADQKSRPPTSAVQARIESLLRQRAIILSADRKDVRKLRSRATFILGSTVIAAAASPDGQQIADWLRDRVRQLPRKDQDVIRSAFPQIFSSSSGADAPATANGFLPAQPAAHANAGDHK